MVSPAANPWPRSPLAPRRTASPSNRSLCPGTQEFWCRDKCPRAAPENRKCAVAETERQKESPPIAGICRLFRKSPRTRDCVVVDAVAIEPVSASEFPANREINREFCKIQACCAVFVSNRSMNSATWSETSLRERTGNSVCGNRENILGEQGIGKRPFLAQGIGNWA